MSTKCALCNVYLRKVQGFKKQLDNEADIKDISNITGRKLTLGCVICNKCRMDILRKRNAASTSTVLTIPSSSSLNRFSSTSTLVSPQTLGSDPTFTVAESVSSNEDYIEMQIPRVISTHRACCVCGSEGKLIVVPFDARVQSFVKRGIFIPKNNRCCANHIIKNRFFDDDLQSLKIYCNKSIFEASDLTKLLGQLAVNSDLSLLDKFGTGGLPESQLLIFTGLNWENIQYLSSMLASMRDSRSRTVLQALIVFLFKLRSGNSNKLIASILGLEHEQLVSEYSNAVIKAFEIDILPYHFGLEAMSRDTLIQQHTSEFAKRLYNVHDKLFIICDGTYIRHQKSANNDYQRKSYSGQKKVPLCKPFTICTTDGYVIDILGPYLANQNDAEILENIMSDQNGLSKLLQPEDIFVVDRGFRDVKSNLEDKGFKVLMPALKGKRSQLTTEESNESRFVTKLRWVVGCVHGIIKQKYQLLDHKINNNMLPKVRQYCRIACYLLNTFGQRLNSDKDMIEDVVQRMLNYKDSTNSLAEQVETQRWARRKTPFQKLSSNDLLDFPEMTERDLKILFTGSYQYSQAVSYLAEMITDDGTINLQYLKLDEKILKVEVRSRHITRKIYHCFIQYEPNTTGVTGVTLYCCNCPNGRRTVGCCSHVAAVIYYLSHARYTSKIVKPAEKLSKLFINEGILPVINEDSEDDE